MRKVIYWDACDPFLIGPYRPLKKQNVPFVVPVEPHRGFRFGRLISGGQWNRDWPAMDRIVALPIAEQPAADAVQRSEDGVLYFEEEGRKPVPICAKGIDGSIHWSVHPLEWISGLLNEEYVIKWTRPIASRIPFFNYSHLPHSLKGTLQRVLSAAAGDRRNSISFPALPIDNLVEDIRKVCAWLSSGSDVSPEGVWPNNCVAAMTLTHDVDTNWIFERKRWALLREIVDVETSLGYKGAWYIVGDQLHMARDAEAVGYITDGGHEIGSHGWTHDSKLNYLRVTRQERQMRKITRCLAGVNLRGMRTPWYSRSPQLSRVMSGYFRYDSSIPNSSAIFSGGSNSGSCTIFPYRLVNGLLELPMTLPPDSFSDFEDGYNLLRRITSELIDKGGVVVVVFHPQPHQSACPEGLRHYFRFLRNVAEAYREKVWRATPAEIIEHYRRTMGTIAPD